MQYMYGIRTKEGLYRQPHRLGQQPESRCVLLSAPDPCTNLPNLFLDINTRGLVAQIRGATSGHE